MRFQKNFCKMISSKVLVDRIVVNHFKILINANTGKPDFADTFTFFGIPALVSIAFVSMKMFHSDGMAATVITIFSILIGLLMNLLLLVFDLVRKNAGDAFKTAILKELTSSISYCILISLVGILLCLLTQVKFFPIKAAANAILYFVEVQFAITLLMIIKRTYALFFSEAREGKS